MGTPNPPYTLRNTSNEILFLGIQNDGYYDTSFALKPGQYMSMSDIDSKFYITDGYTKQRLKDAILNNVGKDLTLTDKDGTVISSSDYRADNP